MKNPMRTLNFGQHWPASQLMYEVTPIEGDTEVLATAPNPIQSRPFGFAVPLQKLHPWIWMLRQWPNSRQ